MAQRTLNDAVTLALLSIIKDYVDNKVSSYELATVVTSLPTTDIEENKVYMVPSSETENGNIYTEYIYINGAWEKFGEFKSTISLDAYSTTEEVNSLITSAVNGITSQLANYVTSSSLTSTLADYVKSTDLTTKLASYITTDALDTTLADYLKTTDVEDYTEDEISALAAKVLV